MVFPTKQITLQSLKLFCEEYLMIWGNLQNLMTKADESNGGEYRPYLGFAVKSAYILELAQILFKCMTLNKLLNFSKPHFLIHKMGIIIVPTFIRSWND